MDHAVDEPISPGTHYSFLERVPITPLGHLKSQY